MALVFRAQNDATKVFDRISLVRGKLKYETGNAKQMFDNLRRTRARLQGKHTTDIELFRAFTGWSNGYVTIQEEK